MSEQKKEKIRMCEIKRLQWRLDTGCIRSSYMPLCVILSFFITGVGVAAVINPIDMNGNIGYTYRSLSNTSNSDTVSNQFRGSINADTYFWQPWFLTAQGRLSLTQDLSEYETRSYQDNRVANSNDTTFITGNFDLNLLPRSRAPFLLSYNISDSRVDVFSLENPLTGAGSKEYQTSNLSIIQSYLTEQGHRFQARIDTNDWENKSGETYNDQMIGLEMALRKPKHNLNARTSFQTRERSLLNQEADTAILNIDHFYYPNKALRVDSMLSHYSTEGDSSMVVNSTNQTDYTTDLSQISSFIFWRPQGAPISASGGVRVSNLEGTTTGNLTEVFSVGANAGLFYQYNKNLRFDASLDLTSNDNNIKAVTSNRERLGALYQSDSRDIMSGFTYQWFGSTALQNQDYGEQNIASLDFTLGHDAQRLKMFDQNTNLRISLSQSMSSNNQMIDADLSSQRVDHSASISWNRNTQAATTYYQMTLSDSRSFGDEENDQQFINLQALRNQTINRRNSLSGNLTIQYVKQDFNGQGDSDTVTATVQGNYRNTGVLGVPRLKFLSDVKVWKAATDDKINRMEWENRLDYAVGLLDTSLSWRLLNQESDEDFNIIYIQVTRRF